MILWKYNVNVEYVLFHDFFQNLYKVNLDEYLTNLFLKYQITNFKSFQNKKNR